MIRLYDFELSGSCYKVRLLLSMLSVPYEKVPVDFINKEHKTDKFLKINPFGEIPVLEDGSMTLRDAQAILSYIARKYDKLGIWYPTDAQGTGRVNQWLSTGGNEIMNAAGARLVKILNYPLSLGKLHEGAHRAFAIMDKHLSNRDWLELGHPTIADIACFPYTALAGEGGIDLSRYPNILAWIERFKEIPGFIPMPGVEKTA